MTVIARGAAQVRAYEHAIGGNTPNPESAGLQEALARHVDEEASKQRKRSEHLARLAGRTTEPLLRSILSDRPELRAQLETGRAESLTELHGKYHLIKPKSKKIEPQIVTADVIQSIKGPPYDWQWSGSSPGQTAVADQSAGTYNLNALSEGGDVYAAGSLGVWFYATENNSAQRFAALIEYTDFWEFFAPGDTSCFVNTFLGVWSNSARNWVQEVSVAPNPSAGGSYFQSNSNLPDGDSGTVSSETYFPASANNWYMGVISSTAWGVAGGSIIGSGHARMVFNASVPLVVFGQL